MSRFARRKSRAHRPVARSRASVMSSGRGGSSQVRTARAWSGDISSTGIDRAPGGSSEGIRVVTRRTQRFPPRRNGASCSLSHTSSRTSSVRGRWFSSRPRWAPARAGSSNSSVFPVMKRVASATYVPADGHGVHPAPETPPYLGVGAHDPGQRRLPDAARAGQRGGDPDGPAAAAHRRDDVVPLSPVDHPVRDRLRLGRRRITCRGGGFLLPYGHGGGDQDRQQGRTGHRFPGVASQQIQDTGPTRVRRRGVGRQRSQHGQCDTGTGRQHHACDASSHPYSRVPRGPTRPDTIGDHGRPAAGWPLRALRAR